MSGAPVLVVGNRNYSSWSLRPWLLLRQHGVAFDEVKLALDTPDFARDIARWSPSGRVPVLHHAGATIWDSLAICEYVSETFLDGAGWPRDASARAVARSVSAEMHAGFGALREALPFNCRRRAPAFRLDDGTRRDIARITAIWRECRARCGDGGPFLFGTFSIADAMYAPVASRFVTYDVTVDDISQRWIDAVLALEAMQEWQGDAAAEPYILAATDAL